MNLGTVSVGQNFEARSGNGITDSGVITVSGTSLFHSDVTAKVITLDSVNAMTGAVSITHTGSANVAIDNGTTAVVPLSMATFAEPVCVILTAPVIAFTESNVITFAVTSE